MRRVVSNLQRLLSDKKSLLTRIELLRLEERIVRRGIGPIQDGLFVAIFELADLERRIERCRNEKVNLE